MLLLYISKKTSGFTQELTIEHYHEANMKTSNRTVDRAPYLPQKFTFGVLQDKHTRVVVNSITNLRCNLLLANVITSPFWVYLVVPGPPQTSYFSLGLNQHTLKCILWNVTGLPTIVSGHQT